MYIYRCTIGVNNFKFLKTPNYVFIRVFMDYTKNMVCTEYFTLEYIVGNMGFASNGQIKIKKLIKWCM